MKKLLFSILTLGVVSVATIGATRAYFTDQESVQGNTISTGTLSITNTSEDWMVPVTFSNIYPGYLNRKWVSIKNDGTLPITSLTVTAVNIDDQSDLLSNLTGWLNANIVGSTDDPSGVQVGYNTSLKALLNNADVLTPANHTLQPGQTTKVQVQFQMPATLGDNWQGKSATFDLLFKAQQ